MTKIKFNKLPLVYPLPSILVGTVINGRTNFMTLGNCGIISVEPSVIYISMDKSHYTNKGIKDNQVFSINLPSVDLVEKVDYCGLVSGNSVDKSQVFECFYESSDKIPMIRECPINMECKVIKTFDIYNMEVFIGEVIETYVSQDLLTNGFPDTKKINPLIYNMDNMYWGIGDIIANAFKEGSKYKR